MGLHDLLQEKLYFSFISFWTIKAFNSGPNEEKKH
jgi:hypothetical protein